MRIGIDREERRGFVEWILVEHEGEDKSQVCPIFLRRLHVLVASILDSL